MSEPPTTRPLEGYALRFISGKYQGGEFKLPSRGEIVIGRSSELDMVLVEDMVSRRHAKISVTEDGEILIQDLGSTNGSFVNGEKIQRSPLNEGDRILIGTSIIKLVTADPSSESAPRLQDVAAGKRTSQVRTMTGSIGEVPLPDLMQLFSTSKKSGVLTVRTGHDTGKIFLDNGRIVFATINENYDVSPLKNLFRIVAWTDGTFEMDPPEEREFSERIDMSTEALLMEAMRHLDEIQRLGEDLPSMHAQLTLALPMIPSLRELESDQLDVLQLSYNYGHVETVLNKSKASDLETLEIVVKLVKVGYLRAE